MDGFAALFQELTGANGLEEFKVISGRSKMELPGFFRPTKQWDVLVFVETRLIAAVEMKSHVGPSFGNNFNNRVEEALGSSSDLATAYREGGLGEQPPPFKAWLIVVEDCRKSRSPVRTFEPHFKVFPEFKGGSYLQRYALFCQKLVQEQFYDAAALLTSSSDAVETGEFGTLSELSSLKTLVSAFAGHIAAEAARLS